MTTWPTPQEAIARPSYFGYRGGNDKLFETWSLGPVILTRDSNLREESNAAVLKKVLEEKTEFNDKWEIVSCSHWAVGWVEHLSYEAIGPDGEATDLHEWLGEWFGGLLDYPFADDSDFYERQYEATIKNITDVGYSLVDDAKAPEDWAEQVFDWFRDNDENALEDHDDTGAYPSKEQMEAALRALGWLEDDEDEE